MSSPTWYDLLGVAPDATPAEIKAAWRDATDKFEPGSGAGQFRLFNEAADVLLDPERRAAYDAELTEQSAAGPVVDEPDEAGGPAEAAEPDQPEQAETVIRDAPVLPPPAPAPVSPPPSESFSAPAVPQSLPAKVYASVISVPALIVLAVLALASVVLAAVLFFTSDAGEQADTFTARRDAQAVAQRALDAALSYDYRRLDTDRDTAASYMTPALAKKFLRSYSFNANPQQDSPATAKARKVSVEANVLATGVIDASVDRVRLLVFVDQQVTDIDGGPTNRENRVIATLVRRNGKWLLDDLENRGTDYPSGGSQQVPTPTPSATPAP